MDGNAKDNTNTRAPTHTTHVTRTCITLSIQYQDELPSTDEESFLILFLYYFYVSLFSSSSLCGITHRGHVFVVILYIYTTKANTATGEGWTLTRENVYIFAFVFLFPIVFYSFTCSYVYRRTQSPLNSKGCDMNFSLLLLYRRFSSFLGLQALKADRLQRDREFHSAGM